MSTLPLFQYSQICPALRSTVIICDSDSRLRFFFKKSASLPREKRGLNTTQKIFFHLSMGFVLHGCALLTDVSSRFQIFRPHLEKQDKHG